MSYGATVGESAANSNLSKLKNLIFTPVLNKSYVHCDFSKWFIDYIKNANEFKLFVLLLIFSIHISGPAIYRSKSKSLIGLRLGGYKYKIYNMMTVNFVIYTHQVNSKFTT